MDEKTGKKNGDRVVRTVYLLYLGYILGAILLVLRIAQLQLTYQPNEKIADLFHPRNIKQNLFFAFGAADVCSTQFVAPNATCPAPNAASDPTNERRSRDPAFRRDAP